MKKNNEAPKRGEVEDRMMRPKPARVCPSCKGTRSIVQSNCNGDVATVQCRRCQGSGWAFLFWLLTSVFCLLPSAPAATVTGLLSTASSNPYATNLLFTPVSTPLVNGNSLIGSAPSNVLASSAGVFSVALKAGDYRVNIGELKRDTFIISVPTNSATYNITDLITNALTYTVNASPNYELRANRGQVNGYASLDGSGLVPTNQIPAMTSGGSTQNVVGAAGTFNVTNRLKTSNVWLSASPGYILSADLSRGLVIEDNGQVTPVTDDTHLLGASNKRWSQIWGSGPVNGQTLNAYSAVNANTLTVSNGAYLAARNAGRLLRTDSSTNIAEVSSIGGELLFDGTNLSTYFNSDITPLARSNFFPNVTRRMAIGKPVRIATLGDSVSYLTATACKEALANYYGYAGGAFSDGIIFAFTLSSGSVTNKTPDTNWWFNYYDLGAAGFIITTNYQNGAGPGGVTLAERADVYYDAFTNAGGFNIEIRTNGGAFYVTQSVNCASTVLTGRVASVDLVRGGYQLKVTGSNATTKVLGLGLALTNSTGVRMTALTAAGIDLSQLSNVTSRVTVPIMGSLAPDLLFIESTSDAAGTASNSLANWETTVGYTLTNTDVIYLGTPPIDASYNFDYLAQNALTRAAAARYGRIFFDQSKISGTFSNMQYLGFAGDGIHRTNLIDRMFASALLRVMGFGESYEAGALNISSHTNKWTADQEVNAHLYISGSDGGLFVEDRLDAFKGWYGRIYTYNAGVYFGSLVPFGSFDFFKLDLGYGVATPTTLGGAWGRSGFPFQFHGTNSIEYGNFVSLGGVQASSIRLTNNTTAPTAASIGANNGWLQCSNNVLYWFSTANGSVLNTTKIGP